MALWLTSARDDQQTTWLMRFDPRFWTVDFPRPMMAALTTPAPDCLRVDAAFLRKNDLAGLIWESEDTRDHPLLGYQTDRDYRHCVLSFRWRSAGVLPLDAVNGPTLTIEGRDATGAARQWYVRLWNYAKGSATDAQVELRFSDLAGGFSLPAEADPVWPAAIDRLFLSLVPEGYDGSDAVLPGVAEAWVELSGIRCDGRATLKLGDVWLPAHGANLCTAYDDSYNLTPARVLRTVRQLGYGMTINHYIGMSHYFPLVADGAGGFVLASGGDAFCGPALAWHRELFARAAATGHEVIASLSFEILAQHCPPAWQQRALDGTPGRTGWDPPSALLSPANADATAWLRKVAVALVGLQQAAGLKVRVQVGEPWWWITAEGAICLYDDAAKAALGGNPVAIPDMRAALDGAQCALLDAAGAILAGATNGIAAAVKTAGGADAETLLLAFLPTVLDPATPEARRANLPLGWASPAFDVLQIEDYDWLTGGFAALRRQGRALVEERLGYPRSAQHYLAGFVLDAASANTAWPLIDEALDEAASLGVAARFVWAMPQVCRDGYTRMAAFEDDDPMVNFDDVLYPIPLGREASVLPEFSTSVTITASGHERRNSLWSDARMRFDVGPGIRSDHELGLLIAFFRARRGMARGFRLRDPSDYSSADMTGAPGPLDQLLGVGDGAGDSFALVKHYGTDAEPQTRRITRPRVESLRISVGGVERSDGWTLEELGVVRFADAIPAGAEVRAGFLFDVPVRFAEDQLEISGSYLSAGEAPSVPLVEIREAV